MIHAQRLILGMAIFIAALTFALVFGVVLAHLVKIHVGMVFVLLIFGALSYWLGKVYNG